MVQVLVGALIAGLVVATGAFAVVPRQNTTFDATAAKILLLAAGTTLIVARQRWFS